MSVVDLIVVGRTTPPPSTHLSATIRAVLRPRRLVPSRGRAAGSVLLNRTKHRPSST